MILIVYEQNIGSEGDDTDNDNNAEDDSHGMRICIKRKKIDYGKFFDFCAEKCVYN